MNLILMHSPLIPSSAAPFPAEKKTEAEAFVFYKDMILF